MADANPDLRKIATRYRDKLKSELARVEEFLAMADRLAKSNGELESGLADFGEAEPESDGAPINVFRDSG